MTKQRLELTWYNKDMALIPTEVGKYGYTGSSELSVGDRVLVGGCG